MAHLAKEVAGRPASDDGPSGVAFAVSSECVVRAWEDERAVFAAVFHAVALRVRGLRSTCLRVQ